MEVSDRCGRSKSERVTNSLAFFRQAFSLPPSLFWNLAYTINSDLMAPVWCSGVPCQHIFQSMWQHESQFRIKLRLISVVSSSDFEKSMFCFCFFHSQTGLLSFFCNWERNGVQYSTCQLLFSSGVISYVNWTYVRMLLKTQNCIMLFWCPETFHWNVSLSYCKLMCLFKILLSLFCTPEYDILMLLFALELLCGKTYNSL